MMGTPSPWRYEDWPLVGRNAERSAILQVMDAVRLGRGGTVVVEGPPGSGRTRLLREAALRARDMGFRVVWLPERAEVADLLAAAMDDAARGRAVLVVDDQEPAALAAPSAIQLAHLPALVLTSRTVGIGQPSGGVPVDPFLVRILLRPLEADAIAAMAEHVGIAPPSRVLERLRAATGGHALLVVETLCALAGTDTAAEPEVWPVSTQAIAWMRRRLESDSPVGRAALEAASVLGEECDLGIAGRMLTGAWDPRSVEIALGANPFVAASCDGTRCRFVPPLARELVYASLSASRRDRLHAGAARALAAGGGSPSDVLAHRALAAAAAGDARGCEHHVRVLVQAAGADLHAAASCAPYFKREGEHWAVGFGGRAIRLNDRTGLLYLAHLLSRPGAELSSLTLGERRRGEPPPDDALDEPSLAAERARVRVTRRIRDGIDRIAQLHPELGTHLEQTIRTGARCAYMVDPASAPRWEVRW